MSGPVFMFCTPGLVFGGTVGVGSHFHVLRSRTHFRRYQGRRVPFSCSVLPDLFCAVPRASGPVFMFSAPGLIFGDIEGVGSHFLVLRSRTRFPWYRESRVPFSCFARHDSFSAIPKASDPVFMFCASELVFDGTDGVGSRFHILRSRICFWRCGERRLLFSCFALPNSFSALPSTSTLVFMFCAPKLILNGTDGVGSRYHFLCSRTHFRWCRGRRVRFSCFVLPGSFSTVPRVSSPVFMFCAPRLILCDTEGVGSRFHVLRARTHIRRYRERRLSFSCVALPDSFPVVPRSSGPIFMF
jgi:hypothetical protein